MSATIDQFKELVEAEDSVHIGKLVDIAKHGIPDKIRGEVWKFLLGVSKFDKSQEMQLERRQSQEYLAMDKSASAEIRKRIKQNVCRLYTKNEFFQQESIQLKLENVLCAYLNYHGDSVEYSPKLISLLAPFVYSLKSEPDIFWCFEAFMKRSEYYFGEMIGDLLARFMMYVRTVSPDLFNHFEEEELSPNDWAMSWLNYLLARELPLPCVLRLWDTYLSDPEDGLDLHIYVCIAILVNCAEELAELEISELLSFLQHLPSMDMDEIISQAINIRDEIRSSGGLIE